MLHLDGGCLFHHPASYLVSNDVFDWFQITLLRVCRICVMDSRNQSCQTFNYVADNSNRTS